MQTRVINAVEAERLNSDLAFTAVGYLKKIRRPSQWAEEFYGQLK